jgi:hypothetical protein
MLISCCDVVFMDESAESIATLDVGLSWTRSRVGALLRCAARMATIVFGWRDDAAVGLATLASEAPKARKFCGLPPAHLPQAALTNVGVYTPESNKDQSV